MAKSYANLWPRMVSWNNLTAAYERCRRRKRNTPDATRFDFAWESELLRLKQELCDGSYSPGAYRNFYIHEPKRRKISAAPIRDRIVHHAVVRVLEPLYESRFIYDSFACRRRKGTHRAIDRAQYYLRRHKYCLKTDVVRFFPNVDHMVLLDLIGRRIRDREVLQLLAKIISSGEGVLTGEATDDLFPGDDLFALCRPKGLPIGNLTSQFFANVLLDQIDHFVKEELQVPGYVRYADDLALFGDDRRLLWDRYERLKRRLAGLRLKFNPQKTQLRPCAARMKFLGFVLGPDERRLQQSTLLRFNNRLRRWRWLWKHSEAQSKDIRASLAAFRVHAENGNAKGVLRSIWPRVRFNRGISRSISTTFLAGNRADRV